MTQEQYDLIVREQKEQADMTRRELAEVKARLQRVEVALAYYDLEQHSPIVGDGGPQWNGELFDANAPRDQFDADYAKAFGLAQHA
jgi:hypothetical protein